MSPMDAPLRLLAALAPTAWAVAGAAYLAVFVRDDPAALRWAPRLAWAAAFVHAASVAAPGFAGTCPMLMPASMISGLGLAVGVIHLLLEGRAGRRAIGVFPVTIAMVFALAGAAFDPLRRPDASLPPASTALH